MAKGLYFFLVILSSIQNTFGQEKIFDSFDFKNGNYSLVLLDVKILEEQEFKGHSFEDYDPQKPIVDDRRNHVFIENLPDLIKIQDSWIGKPVDYMYWCWYDYFVYLLKNDEVVSEMKVNFECRELLVDGVPYEFDSTHITSILSKGEKIYQIEVNKDSLDEARQYYWKVVNNPDLLMKEFYHPIWVDYEGQFEVEFVDDYKNKDSESKVRKFVNSSDLVNYDLKNYGKSYTGGSKVIEYSFRIFCNEQPDSIVGLEIEKDWAPFKGPFKMTFIKRNNAIID